MPPETSPKVLPGRVGELALLDGLMRDLARGAGNAVLVEGEPGIGKTALVRAALRFSGSASQPREGGRDGTGAGCQVFWGAGDELGQELPLHPFLDSLQVRMPSANARRKAVADLLRGETAADRGADVPALLAEQLIALIIDETGARPMVLVIDDLHWADPASVRLWGRLARVARQVPLLLIGITRPVPQREDLSALRRAVEDGHRVQLRSLPRPAVTELVGALAGGKPDAGLLRLAAGAGGNPLYLTEMLAALARSGGISVTPSGLARLADGTVPDSLTGTIADRLGFVSAPTMEVLKAAALLGVEFAITDLTAVLGRTVAALVPAIDEARATGVLADSRTGLAFRHPLIRDALYAEMPASMRAAWHHDAGHALALAGASPDRVARQLLRALGRHADPGERGPDASAPGGARFAALRASSDTAEAGKALDAPRRPGSTSGRARGGPPRGSVRSMAVEIERPPGGPDSAWSSGPVDEWMMDWLAASAESLVGQAPGVAAELLGQALSGVPAWAGRQGWLAGRLADALYRTGDREEAVRVAERALGYATDPDLVVDLHWTLAQCRMLAGSGEESFATIGRALAAPGLSPKHRARLLVLSARTYLYFGDLDAAGQRADGALAAAAEADDAWATGWALHALAIAAAISGDLAKALPLWERGIAVTKTDHALTDLGLLLAINKAAALCNFDRFDEAIATAKTALELANQTGTAFRLSQAHGVLGQIFFETGRWDDALTEIARVPMDLKEPAAACDEISIIALISFHRNEPETARRHLDAATPYAGRSGLRVIPPLLLAQSLEREQCGRPSEAGAVLAATINDNPDEPGETEDLLMDAVRLALKAGDETTAQTLACRAAGLAAESEIPHRRANALYCRGIVDRDAPALFEAARLYAEAGRPLPRAKALEAAAGCLVEASDRDLARPALEGAVEAYASLRAEADLNRVQAEFRGYGIRRGPRAKHRTARSGWESLTDTELKVAAYVQDGLTNPEIAARLMLSPRTVGTHVSHILKKLKVTGRTEIARESALRTGPGNGAARSVRDDTPSSARADDHPVAGAGAGVVQAEDSQPVNGARARRSPDGEGQPLSRRTA